MRLTADEYKTIQETAGIHGISKADLIIEAVNFLSLKNKKVSDVV